LFLKRSCKNRDPGARRDTCAVEGSCRSGRSQPEDKFSSGGTARLLHGRRREGPRDGGGNVHTGEESVIPVGACSSRSATRRVASCSPASLPSTLTAPGGRGAGLTGRDRGASSACGDVVDHVYRQALPRPRGVRPRIARGAVAGPGLMSTSTSNARGNYIEDLTRKVDTNGYGPGPSTDETLEAESLEEQKAGHVAYWARGVARAG